MLYCCADRSPGISAESEESSPNLTAGDIRQSGYDSVSRRLDWDTYYDSVTHHKWNTHTHTHIDELVTYRSLLVRLKTQ